VLQRSKEAVLGCSIDVRTRPEEATGRGGGIETGGIVQRQGDSSSGGEIRCPRWVVRLPPWPIQLFDNHGGVRGASLLVKEEGGLVSKKVLKDVGGVLGTAS
jgi:hypothetical protein